MDYTSDIETKVTEILSIVFNPNTEKKFTPGFGPDSRHFFQDDLPQGSFSSLVDDSEYGKNVLDLRNSENEVLFSESDLRDLFTKSEAKACLLRLLDEKRCRNGSLSAVGFAAMTVIMKVRRFIFLRNSVSVFCFFVFY